MVINLNDIETTGIYQAISPQSNKPQKVTLPWEKPKIVAILSIFGGRVVTVKNITEAIVRRDNNETFYR